jgi:hypothetical protein
MEEVVNTPEFKEKQSRASKIRWEDPEYKQRLIDIHKISCNEPEYLKKRSEISKRMWEDPEYRKLQSKIQTELNNDPKRKEYFTKLMKEIWADPVYYQRLCDAKKGENNPLWNNGSSDRGYCIKFKKVQPRVRAFFNDTCVDCGKTKEEEGRELSVHHVYSNKNVCCDEDERKLMITVCTSCHGKIPKYRINMTPEYLEKVKNIYDDKASTWNENVYRRIVKPTSPETAEKFGVAPKQTFRQRKQKAEVQRPSGPPQGAVRRIR